MNKRKTFSLVCGLLGAALLLSPSLSLGQEQAASDNAEKPTITQVSATTNAEIKPVMVEFGGQELEKIPSPDQIRNFKVMKNINGSLYGIRLKNITNQEIKTQAQAQVNSSVKLEKRATSSNLSLEKISSPQFIKDYEKIQKIGNALWGVKKVNNAQKTNSYRQVSGEIKDCVSKAITAKDDALKEYLSKNNDSLLSLISARQACQLLALETLDRQADKIASCNRDFQAKHQNIIKSMKESHAKIWNQYRQDLKSCSPASDSQSEAPLIIEDGGSVLMESAGASL